MGRRIGAGGHATPTSPPPTPNPPPRPTCTKYVGLLWPWLNLVTATGAPRGYEGTEVSSQRLSASASTASAGGGAPADSEVDREGGGGMEKGL